MRIIAPDAPQRRRQMAVDPEAQRLQRGMRQRPFEHPPDARQVLEVVGLAVAPQQADEQADDAGMALRRHQREAGAKILGIEAGGADVAFHAGGVDCGRHVAARILDQRDEVIGGMAALGVLEIEQAAGAHARPRRQPQQIVLVVVAQQQRAGAGRQRGEAGVPRGAILLGLLRRRRTAARLGQIPFGDQHRGIDQRLALVVAETRQQPMVGRSMDGDQNVGGARVKRSLVAAGREHAREGVVAQVLQQQEAVGGIFGKDFRRAEPHCQEMAADAYERPNVLLRRRRIHHDGGAARTGQPIVFPERGIARQQALLGIAPAGAVDKGGAQDAAVRRRGARAVHHRPLPT